MTDYGHDLLFGTILLPTAGRPADIVPTAQLSERAGLDLVSVPDHPYQPGYLDAWAVLAVVAASTTRVRVFPNVANLPLRPPAAMARGAAALDLLSGGRVEIGLGAGAYWDGIVAEGGPRRSPGEAVVATGEAIEVMRALWSGGPGTRREGEHYSLYGAAPGPAPAHDISVWVGAVGPRMLRLVGRTADGWLPSAPHIPPAELAAGHRIVDEAAQRAGRSPADVRRLYNLSPGLFPQGPPEVWAEQLAALALEHGTSAFLLPANSPELLRFFGEEVAPATREAVAAERARGGGTGTPEPEPGPVPAPVRAAARTEVSAGAGALTVRPTPDDGVRLSSVRLWDETSRPSGPPVDPERRYTRHEQEPAGNLVASHDQLRADLAQLRDIVEQVAAESLQPGEARTQLYELSVRQNSWTLGAYCASYCRLTTVHHEREDADLFPHLRKSDPRLGPVLDRLTEEHHAIHGVIERIDQALVALVGSGGAGGAEADPGGGGALDGLRDSVDLLTDALLSHLAYEERELVEPMARFGTGW